jgi:hypothetical protein
MVARSASARGNEIACVTGTRDGMQTEGASTAFAPGRPPAPPAAAPPAPPLRQQYLTLRHQQWWCMAQASALVWRARLRLAAAQAPGCVPILLLAGPRFYPTDPGRPL